MLVLVIGDLFIPQRERDIPEALKNLLVPGKIQHIICTGNLIGKTTFDYLKSICPTLHCLKGKFDTINGLKETFSIKIEDFNISVCQNHEFSISDNYFSAESFSKKNNSDIIVFGGIHKLLVHKSINSNLLIINPGSATGAFLVDNLETIIPSFVLIDFQKNNAVVYTYELDVNNNVKVNKIEHTKV